MIGKTVIFIEDSKVVVGEIIKECTTKGGREYVAKFYDEGEQQRILEDYEWSNDVFAFNEEKFIEKVKEAVKQARDDFEAIENGNETF